MTLECIWKNKYLRAGEKILRKNSNEKHPFFLGFKTHSVNETNRNFSNKHKCILELNIQKFQKSGKIFNKWYWYSSLGI